MKKIFVMTASILCCITFGFGQSGIYGGGFERWKIKPVYNFYEPDSSYFSTLNQLDTVAAMRPMVTVYPCDTAHSGIYSARLVTRYYNLLNITIPGVIGTLKIDFNAYKALLGIPYPYGDSMPRVFSGYFQSYPLGNDSSAAVILLSRWNTTVTPPKRDTLAYNFMRFYGKYDTWTKFEMPVIYWNTTMKPDSLTILLTSCAGFNASNFFGSHGQTGSMAMFDDVSLTGVNGFPFLLMPSVGVKIAPNPASDILRIELGSAVRDGYFEVYSAEAKLIRKYPLNGVSGQISVADLCAGVYYYKLTRNGKLLNSGTFIVTK